MKILKVENSRNLTHNGKQSQNESLFFNKEKENKFRRETQTKAILCIILTNILTFLIFSSKSSPKVNQRVITLSGRELVQVKLIPHTPLSKGKQITLFNTQNKVISRDAIIEKKLKEDEQSATYIVQIQNEDLEKVAANQNAILHAFPRATKVKSKRRSYEVIF